MPIALFLAMFLPTASAAEFPSELFMPTIEEMEAFEHLQHPPTDNPDIAHRSGRSSSRSSGSRSSGSSRSSSSRSSSSRSSRSSSSRSSSSRSSSSKSRSSSRPSSDSRGSSGSNTSERGRPTPKAAPVSPVRPSTGRPTTSRTGATPNRAPVSNGRVTNQRATTGQTRSTRTTTRTTTTGTRATGTRTVSRSTTVSGRSVSRPTHGARPTGGTRTYSRGTSSRPRPPSRSGDPRYSRPSHTHVTRYRHSRARYVAPGHYYYRPYYTRWWVHPYYRYTYSTRAVVFFSFTTNPWYDTWAPPSRAGWTWVPGAWRFGFWSPGYWTPVRRAPANYVYVPGWWEGNVYVEGYYRVNNRPGWRWRQGQYVDEGQYARGDWQPDTDDAPEGYTWEAGFYDGDTWIDGFYRPDARQGFAWVSAYYDEDGVYHSGYWMPGKDKPGQIWVPGWFDGNEWQKGYWEDESTFTNADVENFQQEEGAKAGWDEAPGATIRKYEAKETGDRPLALPVEQD